MTEHASQSWRHKAACRNEDPETFFPLHEPEADDARVICLARCPVRDECGLTAVRGGEKAGVWAGYFLPDESRQLKLFVATDEDPVEARWCDTCGKEMHTRIALRTCHECRYGAGDIVVVRQHIADLRDRGMSLREISAESGVDRPTVSEVASGKRARISATSAEKILGVSAAVSV